MARGSKWLSWTGPLFAVLFLGVGMVLDSESPGEKASAAEIVEFFNDHEVVQMVSVFASPLACALLILFVAHLRSVARRDDGVDSAGPTVMVAGAVLWAAGLLIDATLTLAAVTASSDGQDGVAETVNVLLNHSWLPFVGGMAVTLIGGGMTALGGALLPRWLGWVGVVVGVVSLLGPGGFVGFFVAPLWLLAAGVMLIRRPAT